MFMQVAVTIQRACQSLQDTCIYVHARTRMHTHTHHLYTTQKWNGFPSRYVILYRVFQHASMYIHIHTHTFIYIPLARGMDFLLGMLLCILSVSACMHAHVCTFIHTHTHGHHPYTTWKGNGFPSR